MKMTYRQALEIQERQLVWYRQAIGRQGVKAIRNRTKPCPDNPDKPISVSEINDLVPRGGSFERYITKTSHKKDPLTFHWYKAMENDKLYSA